MQNYPREHEAHWPMTVGGVVAVTAAHRVGYENPSRFSREYLRLFNAPPRAEVVLARGMPQG